MSMPTFDPIDTYPNRVKFFQNPGYMENQEILPSGLSPEVELIARASYKLGGAETALWDARDHAKKYREEAEGLKGQLERVIRDRDDYKRERDDTLNSAQLRVDQINKLQKKLAKLNPKKKSTKKEKK